jgi:hypothetical protein
MAKNSEPEASNLGVQPPSPGAFSPVLAFAGVGLLALAALTGCNNGQETQRTLNPVALGMSDQETPVYSDDEMTLYESKLPVQLPILAPTQTEMNELKGGVQPYGREPWLKLDDTQVRLNWTLTNLDKYPHDVELMIDPWNEFGRYYPGMELTDPQEQTFEPNLSGIDIIYHLDGSNSGATSRMDGTFTVQDMDELAIDFATVMNIIKLVPASTTDDNSDDMGDYSGPLALANHAFNVQNRSYDDPLIAKYIPKVIAGLTGFDIGLRTREPANVALEFVVEMLDPNGTGKVVAQGSTSPTLKMPTKYVTLGQTAQ